MDKGNGIVILNRSDYAKSHKSIFDDKSKFTRLKVVPTSTRLNTLQNYLLTLRKRNEISEEDFNFMRPKTANFGRAQGMPKTHKTFTGLLAFRPIVDTTSTPHYNVGKFLSSILNPLTLNDYNLRGSFDAVSVIRSIPQNLFDEGYRFVSFDVESLFTNVPLKRTIRIVLKRIFEDKLINRTLRKRSLKMLLLDCATKTAFSFDNTFYEQTDGVSMGSLLSSCLSKYYSN